MNHVVRARITIKGIYDINNFFRKAYVQLKLYTPGKTPIHRYHLAGTFNLSLIQLNHALHAVTTAFILTILKYLHKRGITITVSNKFSDFYVKWIRKDYLTHRCHLNILFEYIATKILPRKVNSLVDLSIVEILHHLKKITDFRKLGLLHNVPSDNFIWGCAPENMYLNDKPLCDFSTLININSKVKHFTVRRYELTVIYPYNRCLGAWLDSYFRNHEHTFESLKNNYEHVTGDVIRELFEKHGIQICELWDISH